MTIKAIAQSIDISLNDDEALSSLYIKWGPIGQYIDITREDDDGGIYCEVSDQANGAEFESIKFKYSKKLLVLEVTPPETLIQGTQEYQIDIDLDGVAFDEQKFVECLIHLFRRLD
ncbi:hypothetical protein [Burkholderia sp. S171]|uniref:hypothetical protein n=1 Tax=Burkholderia sp. S171 TaxID=1641860 RepID=UPI00131E5E3D|nr:hypothetical protein [Burkholderia sp. S171]